MANIKSTRHFRRESAFKLLFAYEFDGNADPGAFFAAYTAEFYDMDELGDFDNDYVKSLFFGVCEKKEELDAAIEKSAVKWKMSRMSAATRTILRLAVYEMLYTDTPPKVAINEAIEITKSYGDGGAPSFVNGILNGIAKTGGLFDKEGSLSAADKEAADENGVSTAEPENGAEKNDAE